MAVSKELEAFESSLDELLKSIGEEPAKSEDKSEDLTKAKKAKDEDEDEDEDEEDEDEIDEDEDKKPKSKKMKKSVEETDEDLNKSLEEIDADIEDLTKSVEGEDEYLEVSPFLKSFADKVSGAIQSLSKEVKELKKAVEAKGDNGEVLKSVANAIKANGDLFKSVASQPLPKKSVSSLTKSVDGKEVEIDARTACEALLKALESGKLEANIAGAAVARIESTGFISEKDAALVKSIL